MGKHVIIWFYSFDENYSWHSNGLLPGSRTSQWIRLVLSNTMFSFQVTWDVKLAQEDQASSLLLEALALGPVYIVPQLSGLWKGPENYFKHLKVGPHPRMPTRCRSFTKAFAKQISQGLSVGFIGRFWGPISLQRPINESLVGLWIQTPIQFYLEFYLDDNARELILIIA